MTRVFTRAPTIDEVLDFVQDFIKLVNECWEWQRTTGGGVPQNRIRRGKDCKVENLTQAVWEAYHGERASGAVYRWCRNRRCINPHHFTIELPPKTNRAQRALSDRQVSYLRRRYREGMRRGELRDMQKVWGVAQDTLHRAARGDSYKDVHTEPRPRGTSTRERFQITGVELGCSRERRRNIAIQMKTRSE